MNSSDFPIVELEDRDEFETALHRLLESATKSDIEIRGAYHFKPADGGQEYGVEISRVRS